MRTRKGALSRQKKIVGIAMVAQTVKIVKNVLIIKIV